MAGVVTLWTRAKQAVLPYRDTAPGMAPAPQTVGRLPWWLWALAVIPLLVLAAAAIYLALRYDEIPDPLAVHWGASGKADRWAPKSFRSVFATPCIGASVLVLLYGLGLMMAAGRGAARTLHQLLLWTLGSLLAAAYLVTFLFTRIALHPLLGNPQASPVGWWIVIFVIALPVAILLSPLLRLSEEAAVETGAGDEGWIWGDTLYSNRADPAMMVPRRMGAGLTPNLGHPLVRIVFPLLMLQLFATMFFMMR